MKEYSLACIIHAEFGDKSNQNSINFGGWNNQNSINFGGLNKQIYDFEN